MNATQSKSELIETIESQFAIERIPMQFGEIALEVYRVQNPDSLLDDVQLVTPHAELKWQPYWAQTWDAALGLAEYLETIPLQNQHVLDLGCGLGVSGAVAAARGATVVLVDNALPCLDFARLNCWPWRQRATVHALDWQRDQLPNQFDLIMAADILYDRADIPHLDRFWRNHLSEGAEVIHADPCRAMTRDFFDALKNRGWSIHHETRTSHLASTSIRISSLRPLP